MCDTGIGKIADMATELLRLTRGDYGWPKDIVDFKFEDYYKALEWFSKARCPTCLKPKEPRCAVLKCKKARKPESCLLCDTFLTCPNTEHHRKRYSFVKKHYQRMKKVGLGRHFKAERQRARRGARLIDIRDC
jgi:hypothetical protein